MKKSAFLRIRSLRMFLFALALTTGYLPVGARASTVLQMDFATVVDSAQLIFEGKVSSVESRQVPDGTIHTFVTMEVTDILKGRYSSPQIELDFLGGKVGERRLEVIDLQIPSVGETGFYFVESLTTTQVNPLVGWSQGHYLIESAPDGGKMVTTSAHEPIVTLDAVSQKAEPAGSAFSKGVAKGVVTRETSSLTQAMTAEDFKNSVEAIVAQAQ